MKLLGQVIVSSIVTILSLFLWNGVADVKLPFWPFFWAAVVIPLGVCLFIGLVAAMLSDE